MALLQSSHAAAPDSHAPCQLACCSSSSSSVLPHRSVLSALPSLLLDRPDTAPPPELPHESRSPCAPPFQPPLQREDDGSSQREEQHEGAVPEPAPSSVQPRRRRGGGEEALAVVLSSAFPCPPLRYAASDGPPVSAAAVAVSAEAVTVLLDPQLRQLLSLYASKALSAFDSQSVWSCFLCHLQQRDPETGRASPLCSQQYQKTSRRSFKSHLWKCLCRHFPPLSSFSYAAFRRLCSLDAGVMSGFRAVMLFPRLQRKRRSTGELEDNERWSCPNGCGQLYRNTSCTSILRHLSTDCSLRRDSQSGDCRLQPAGLSTGSSRSAGEDRPEEQKAAAEPAAAAKAAAGSAVSASRSSFSAVSRVEGKGRKKQRQWLSAETAADAVAVPELPQVVAIDRTAPAEALTVELPMAAGLPETQPLPLALSLPLALCFPALFPHIAALEEQLASTVQAKAVVDIMLAAITGVELTVEAKEAEDGLTAAALLEMEAAAAAAARDQLEQQQHWALWEAGADDWRLPALEPGCASLPVVPRHLDAAVLRSSASPLQPPRLLQSQQQEPLIALALQPSLSPLKQPQPERFEASSRRPALSSAPSPRSAPAPAASSGSALSLSLSVDDSLSIIRQQLLDVSAAFFLQPRVDPAALPSVLFQVVADLPAACQSLLVQQVCSHIQASVMQTHTQQPAQQPQPQPQQLPHLPHLHRHQDALSLLSVVH